MTKRLSLSLLLLLLFAVVVTVVNQSSKSDSLVRDSFVTVLADETPPEPPKPEFKKRRIVVFGSHPEDPEFGCGGLIARMTQIGHEVVIAYTTCFRGNRKVDGEPEADVRRREAAAACKVLGAELHFFNYDHEKLMADEPTLNAVSSWLKEVKPDIVITHWPIDAVSNHHVTSSLVWQSYLRDKKYHLYFFEVLNDRQTIAFKPDLFFDITDVRELKKEACFCHQSQTPEAFWIDHEDMHKLRGKECGLAYAEAFVLAELLPGRATLPLLKKKSRL